jgi:cytochrome b-561
MDYLLFLRRYDEIGSFQNGDSSDLAHLTIGIILAQVVGLIMVILSGVWMGKYHNGYGWDISTVFNYHPLFMTIGMIFLYGDGKLFQKSSCLCN